MEIEEGWSSTEVTWALQWGGGITSMEQERTGMEQDSSSGLKGAIPGLIQSLETSPVSV